MKTQINVVFLFLFILTLLVGAKSQGDTTTFTFDSFSTSKDTLIFQGDAFVPSSSSFARLTKTDSSDRPTQASIGRLVYSPTINFWEEGLQASFETTIRFTITPVNNFPGDGLAFFIVPVNSPIPPGSTDGNLGLFNPSTGRAPSVFAVEFDPAPNLWDPRFPHMGININSRVSMNTSRFESAVGQEVTARINYVSSTRTITVFASYGSVNSTLSYVFDLKTILPKQVQVGISGTTGTWVAYHDLHSWYFSSTLIWDANTLHDKTYIRQYV